VLGALAAPVAAQLEPRELVPLERERVVSAARRYLGEAPMTITAFPAPRSAGGPHDFYSEGDYWWPDPRSPDSPFVRRDGETNPSNFIAHRDRIGGSNVIDFEYAFDTGIEGIAGIIFYDVPAAG